MIFGQYGLTKVEYLGSMNGQWKGIETGALYPFGRDRRMCWVDKRDMPALVMARGPEGERLFDGGLVQGDQADAA